MSNSEDFDCPYDGCGRSFDSKNGLHVHHHHAHGESIAQKETNCEECGKSFSYYPSIKDGMLCSECLDKGIDPVQNRKGSVPYSANKVEVECKHCTDTKIVTESEYQEKENHFCDDSCYQDYRKEKSIIDTQCSECLDSITISRDRYERYKNNYCSDECQHNAYRVDMIEVECQNQNCNNTTDKYPSQYKRTDMNFCSPKCRKEEFNESKKQTVVCENCSTKFKKYNCEINRTASNFCTRDCRYEYESTEDFDHDAYGRGFIEMKRRVRERDNYECQVCGRKKEDLGQHPSVHHITPVRWFVEHKDFRKRDSHYIENGILLCPEHHSMVEWDKIDLDKKLNDEKLEELELGVPVA